MSGVWHTGRCTSRQGESGFTLLEMLVAVAILSGSMAAIFASFSWSAQSARQAALSLEARSIAQTLLAKMNLPGTSLGDNAGETASGLLWHVRVTPYGPEDSVHKFRAAAVTVDIWQRTSTRATPYSLTGLILIPADKRP